MEISIVSTFEEALLLWKRNFWYLAVLTLVTGSLEIILRQGTTVALHHNPPPMPEHFYWWSTVLFSISILSLLVQVSVGALNVAVILGLLRKQVSGKAAWLQVRETVQSYTWTLLRMQWLLFVLALLVMIPFVLIIFIHVTVVNKGILLILAAIYLIFLKYALAGPLIVVENMKAWPALQRSWEMTKGHFGYVAGCYIFLGLIMWGIEWFFSKHLHEQVMTPITIVTHLGYAQVAHLWTILGWCLYIRIKKMEGQRVPSN